MIKNKVSGIARIMGAILILSGWYVVADDNLAANETLQTLFERDVPEHSRQLRALWEEERMLAQILRIRFVIGRGCLLGKSPLALNANKEWDLCGFLFESIHGNICESRIISYQAITMDFET